MQSGSCGSDAVNGSVVRVHEVPSLAFQGFAHSSLFIDNLLAYVQFITHARRPLMCINHRKYISI